MNFGFDGTEEIPEPMNTSNRTKQIIKLWASEPEPLVFDQMEYYAILCVCVVCAWLRLWSHVHICHEQNTRLNALWISMWKVLRDFLTICRYNSQFDFVLSTSVVLVPYEMNKTPHNSYAFSLLQPFSHCFHKNKWVDESSWWIMKCCWILIQCTSEASMMISPTSHVRIS